MLTCEKAESMIDAYLDDDLTNDQKEEFLSHISSCDNCKSALDFAKNVKDTLSSLPQIEVPDSFLDGIHEKIKAEKKPSKIIHLRRYVSLAACLILAVVLSQGPKMAEYLNNDNIGEIIPREISSPVPATISDGDSILTPDIDNESKKSDEELSGTPLKPEVAVTSAPASVSNQDTEAENMQISPRTIAGDSEMPVEIKKSKITIFVAAEDIKKANELADLIAITENGLYFLDKDSFELLKDAFSENGIEYKLSEEPDGFIINFTISE